MDGVASRVQSAIQMRQVYTYTLHVHIHVCACIDQWLEQLCIYTCIALPCCLFDLAYFFLPFFSSVIKHI